MTLLTKKELIREAAERNLEFFIRLIQPDSVLGSVHVDLTNWLTRDDHKNHQIVLLPRGHRKSYIAAAKTVWDITRNPCETVLYISSTANLANKQLKLIKDILTSPIYRHYWPEMVNADEAKREKWTESEISIDHPLRKKEFIRDPTVFTAGLTTNVVGLHCSRSVLDDIVTKENSDTAEGREKVAEQYSLLASIENAFSSQLVVGTRYDADDQYGEMLTKRVQKFSEDGILIGEDDLYELYSAQVESVGDGSGEFLWPRQQRKDGQVFGFNREILEIKRAQYSNPRLFRSQYYNDTSSADDGGIPKECFQYYEKEHISNYQGQWFFKGNRLNVFAAIDFAYSVKKRSDYSCITVVGVDRNMNYYILDIDRFKTDRPSEYFNHILELHQKWHFHKIRAEATAAQSTIINDMKINYIRKLGLALSIEECRPTVDKETRIMSVLEPKYANGQMWHYLGGYCQILEEELMSSSPPHDDIKDALAATVDMAKAPIAMFNYHRPVAYGDLSHPRFGGIA